ncbi:hypothetical protein CYMTET_29552 [Cymbomonas tetramitiformis]|uniref:Mutator-like transposase domain-containing protein n=1 Tax=Cymbomonas tetramitiformis TaxID=36881 RepID=A0AAE0KV14_9CHLO|nr:hypothetical protein CYMTET_29552 [Cymbomonas tetramitiformis]
MYKLSGVCLLVEKLSDPNHLQKLLYKDLEELRKAKGWKGSTLSKTVIDYFNKVYRYVIKSVAVIEDIPGFETDDEKAEWIRGAWLNIVDHAFNIDPTHEACRRYRAPRPDGSFYPWCGVESCKPNWQIHLPHGKFLLLDEVMDEKRAHAAEARRSYSGKSRRLQKRLDKASRNAATGKVSQL